MPLDDVIGCGCAQNKEDPGSNDNACNRSSTELVALLHHAILGGDAGLWAQSCLAVVQGASAISADSIRSCIGQAHNEGKRDSICRDKIKCLGSA